MPTRARAIADLSRRGALASLALAGAAWAFAPRRRSASTPRGRVELAYWEKWTNREGEAIQRVVDRYNASQDRVWVRRTPVADITSKAMVAIGGNDPPDLVGLFTYNIPHFAEAGAVMPMDAFAGAPSPTPFDPGAYAQGVARLLSFEGRQWAGVNTCYTLALYLNRAHLREIGHDPDSPPRTLDELDGLSHALARHHADGSILRAGFLPNLPGWWPTIWPIFFDADVYDPAARRCTIADDACVRSYEWVRACAQRVGPAAGRAFASSFIRSNHSAQDPFISGRVSMILQGPWLSNFINAFNPSLDYTVAPFPVAPAIERDPPPGLLEADVLAIPRGCPHPDEAWNFFTFMQSPPVQHELARAHCKPSPMRVVPPDFAHGHANPFVHVFDAIAKSPRVRILPQTRVWKHFSDLAISAFDAIWLGAPPREQLTSLQTRVQSLLDEHHHRRPRDAPPRITPLPP